MRTRRAARAVVTAAAVALGVVAAAPSAGAVEQLQIRGAGFGHGVGMSQWGARGMALRGSSAAQILAHYYTGTELSRLPAARRVRVALQWGRAETTLSGAASIGGLRVRPERSYRLLRRGSGVEVRDGASGRRLGTARSGVQVVPGGGGTVRVAGSAADGVQDGSFRGRIDVLPDGSGLVVVNDLDLEDYLRGVVTGESPASWPSAALQAQAVAARTYAITSAVGGRAFDQWPDTRSQVYRGVAGETAAGDRAVAATRGRVVTVDRKPVTTYFFSTSGGRTEDVEHVFGGPARSWLKSVADPYEPGAGMRRWTRTFSSTGADARTARFGVGGLRRVEVLRRGDSPRVVRARVVGATGRKRVSGEALQLAFELPDRWASFATVSISRCLRPAATADARDGTGEQDAGDAASANAERAAAGSRTDASTAAAEDRATDAANADTATAADDPATGALAIAERGTRDLAALLSRAGEREPTGGAARGCRLVGGVRPEPGGGADRLQQRRDGAWTTVRRVALDGDGGFEVVVPRQGRWRVAAGGFTTPSADAG